MTDPSVIDPGPSLCTGVPVPANALNSGGRFSEPGIQSRRCRLRVAVGARVLWSVHSAALAAQEWSP